MSQIGILLTNTGTPDAPTPKAVNRYLREFLSDKRVVHLPRLLWLPLLYGLILPIRSRASAKLYENIWTEQGSPMRTGMEKIAEKLQMQLNTPVEVGMNYGNPSIENAIDKLIQKQVTKIIILPLYPQYSNTTTASSFDRITNALKKQMVLPNLDFISNYADHPDYIDALATSIETVWKTSPPSEHLLISFHGLPERFVQAGDPYASHCEKTANLLAQKLQLPTDKWTLCYQSRFGYDKWLMPSTQDLFETLPKRGIKNIDVVCPGFPVDCLETLEEIALRGKESFIEAGGKSLRYIPALHDSDLHIGMLAKLMKLIII